MRECLKRRGIAFILALILAAGAPFYVVQNAIEVSAKAVKKGLKQENGKYYYYEKGVKVKKVWKTVKKKKYYFKADGSAAIGWNKIGNKAYYFNTKAVMVKNKTVDGIKINKKGQASLNNAQVKLAIEVQSVLDKKTKSSQSKAQKLKACYNYIMNKCSYLGRPAPTNSSQPSSWEVSYAYLMLTTKRGNCYNFASAFAMLARGCGYNAQIVVGNITKPGENSIQHAWVIIGGKVYDPQTQQYLKGRGTKVNLFGKAYGKTGEVVYDSLNAAN